MTGLCCTENYTVVVTTMSQSSGLLRDP